MTNPDTTGDEPSGLAFDEVAQQVGQAFSDGYAAGIAAEREKRNARRRKGRPRRSWPTTNDGGAR